MTSMRDGSIPRHRTISRFEKSDSVITRVARRAESHVNVRRRTSLPPRKPLGVRGKRDVVDDERRWRRSQSGHV